MTGEKSKRPVTVNSDERGSGRAESRSTGATSGNWSSGPPPGVVTKRGQDEGWLITACAAKEFEEGSTSYSSGELIAMAQALEQSADYRILRRLVPRGVSKSPAVDFKIGIVVDFETTGLDTSQDVVIEIGMVKFCYSESGDVMAVVDTFSSFNRPSKPLPAEVTILTGIADEIVKGQRIDDKAVSIANSRRLHLSRPAGGRKSLRVGRAFVF